MSDILMPVLRPICRPLTSAITAALGVSYAAIIDDAGQLAPYVTFTRSSTATRYNSAGLLETVAANAPRYDYDPTTVTRANLLRYSQDFDNAYWLKNNASVTSNAVESPFGGTTADLLIPSASSGALKGVRDLVLRAATTTCSVYVKPAGYDFFSVTADNTVGRATINLVDGTSTVYGGSVTLTRTAVGGGWYRVIFNVPSGSGYTIYFGPNSAQRDPVEAWTSDGVSGAYIWGAQLETGSTATDYIPTGVIERGTELVINGDNETLLYSLGTGPTGVNVSVAKVNELGRNCVKAVSTVGTSTSHQITHGIPIPADMAIEVVVDAYVPTGGIGKFLIYDGSDGSVFSPDMTIKNQWITVRFVRPPKGSAWDLRFGNNSSEIISTSDVAFYIDNISVRKVNSDVASPRGNASLRGLLIEEQRTNFYNSSNSYTAGTGTTVTASAAVSPDGTLTASRFAKTDATTPRYSNSPTTMTVSANTAYTVSRCFKYDGFDTTVSLEYNNADNWGAVTWVALFNVTSSGVTVNSQQSCTASVQNIGNGWYRAIATFTTAATIGSPTNPQTLTRITGASGVSVLMCHAQLEAGAFAASYIPTTTAAVTRAADVATTPLTSIGWNASESTVLAEYIIPWDAAGVTRGVAGVDGGSGRFIYSSGSLFMAMYDGTNILSGPAITQNAVSKTASAFSSGGMAICTNNSAVFTSAFDGAFGSSSTVLGIGVHATGSAQLCGHIRRLRYYPVRLSNTQLQALTA